MKLQQITDQDRQILEAYNFELSLCLSEIPATLMQKTDKGKIYANVTVAIRKNPDQWKRDVKVYITQTKAMREAGEAKIYCGAGRAYKFVESDPVQPSTDDVAAMLSGATAQKPKSEQQPEQGDEIDSPF